MVGPLCLLSPLPEYSSLKSLLLLGPQEPSQTGCLRAYFPSIVYPKIQSFLQGMWHFGTLSGLLMCIFFFKQIFTLLCKMSVLLVHLSVNHVCARCAQNPEDVGPLELELQGGHHVGAGNTT